MLKHPTTEISQRFTEKNGENLRSSVSRVHFHSSLGEFIL